MFVYSPRADLASTIDPRTSGITTPTTLESLFDSLPFRATGGEKIATPLHF
jgi:hypothetical protein